MEAAWNILMTDESWRVSTTKGEWQIRLGAHAADALEFIVASEIDELETLLAPIAFRRFKKFLTYEWIILLWLDHITLLYLLW